jgi:uncharacterized repeat protein (TIGR02543 family)
LLEYYLSKPFVQSSYLVDEPGFFIESFDNLSAGPCPATSANGFFKWSGSGCQVSNAESFGGAMTTTSSQVVASTPTIGNLAGSRFATNGSSTLFLKFSESEIAFLGFWWSAGNSVNTVEFYKNNSKLLSVDSGDLAGSGKILGTHHGTYGSTGALSIGGTEYKRHYYWGNPRGYSSLTPTSAASSLMSPSEPFAYISFFAQDGTTFDEVRFVGNGFEFDNVVASTYSPSADLAQLYLVGKVTPAGLLSTVEFDANGGTGSMGSQSTTSATANLNLNQYERQGFTFGGWNTLPNGSGTSFADGALYSFNGNATLYANWIAGNNIVTFSPNYVGGPASSTQSITSGTPTNLVANTFIRSGYTFFNWNTQEDGTGISYSNSANVSITSGINLFARWSANQNTVTFSPNFEDGPETVSQTITTDVLTSLQANPFSRPGFTFLSWNTSADGSGLDYSDLQSISISTGITLYAQWAAIPPSSNNPVPAYRGPIPVAQSPSCAPADIPTEVLVVGERMHSLVSGVVDGKQVAIVRIDSTTVRLMIPALAPGSYDIEYLTDGQGRLTHGNGLKVCARPATESSKIPEVLPKTFSVSKRFVNYAGDRGKVDPQIARAITNFVTSNPGLKTLRCVGSTSGRPAAKGDTALARERARNACAIVQSLVPGIQVTLATSTGRGVGSFFRAVSISGTGTR